MGLTLTLISLEILVALLACYLIFSMSNLQEKVRECSTLQDIKQVSGKLDTLLLELAAVK